MYHMLKGTLLHSKESDLQILTLRIIFYYRQHLGTVLHSTTIYTIFNIIYCELHNNPPKILSETHEALFLCSSNTTRYITGLELRSNMIQN